ncbi:MAG: transposase [Verrucomicrobiales bacterium]|nr:transposase [Verrucomicrobiales bacterium]
MRTARLLGEGRSFYHVMSRVVDRRMIFEAGDKEVFRNIMRSLEAFTGVRVVTYCLMTNHFHLLLDVPGKGELKPLSEDDLLSVLPGLYDSFTVLGVKQELERARLAGNETWREEILFRYEKRRGDMGLFLKDLKQRVTLYMNKRLNRTGTLWEGRYKSVLVEGSETALVTVAAYIDLNPVRAGMVERPEDYRWGGYAEAVSASRGAKQARAGLGTVLSASLSDPDFKVDWHRTQDCYRLYLYDGELGDSAEEAGGSDDRCEDRNGRRDQALPGQRAVPVRQILRRRVRYFCDGAILGTAEFVDAVFTREQKQRQRYGVKRKTGARIMKGADWGELRVLRNLQKEVISSPPT